MDGGRKEGRRTHTERREEKGRGKRKEKKATQCLLFCLCVRAGNASHHSSVCLRAWDQSEPFHVKKERTTKRGVVDWPPRQRAHVLSCVVRVCGCGVSRSRRHCVVGAQTEARSSHVPAGIMEEKTPFKTGQTEREGARRPLFSSLFLCSQPPLARTGGQLITFFLTQLPT